MIEEIEDNIVRLPPAKAMEKLKQKLNGYRRLWNRTYIGVTSVPRRRWAKHARNGWYKMVLLYEAFTPEIARDMEEELIAYAQNCNFVMPLENINPGGEGISDERRSNFVYVLVGDGRRGTFPY